MLSHLKPDRRTLVHTALFAALFTAALVGFLGVGYIDLSVIAAIYLPIGIVVVVAMLLGGYIFGYVFAGAAMLGLLVEYLIHVGRVHPTMSGAFANTTIVALGGVAGVVAQIVAGRHQRSRGTSGS